MTTKTIQMYRTNLDGSETTLYPLTEAKYVTMDDGTTIEEALTNSDSSKYSPVIESSKTVFKVGEGDSVDLSESAIDGAYNSCVLKGKTMVNCIQEPSSQDVVLPYEFEEGQYVTINDTKENGALGVELKGNTLVNLFDTNLVTFSNKQATVEKGVITMPIKNHLYNSFEIPKEKCSMFKPSTTYTLIVDMLENSGQPQENETEQAMSFGLNSFSETIVKNEGVAYNCIFNHREVGRKIVTFTTYDKETYDEKTRGIQFRLETYFSATQGQQKLSIVILEGDYTNVDIPYFTGMTSCKIPILHTTGKNLCGAMESGSLTQIEGEPVEYVSRIRTVDYIPIDGSYWISTETSTVLGLRYYDINKNCIGYPTVNTSTYPINVTNIPSGAKYLKFTVVDVTDVNYKIYLTKEQHTIGEYEPYKTSILSTPSDLELCGIGDVCDTLDLSSGELSQRIGEVVLDGTETDISMRAETLENTLLFRRHLSDAEISSTTIYSDKFDGTPISWNEIITSDKEFIRLYTNDNNALYIRILKSKLETEDVDGFRNWLTKNPLTIKYQRSNVVNKAVDLKVVDQNGNVIPTLKSWNTTTHIYSEIPENSLYPILSHSNPSYPVILKPSTKYSIVANSYSNNHTNSAINFNLGGATASTTVGNRVTTITTPSTLTSEELVMSGRGNKLNNVMVIEGDVVGDEPYFEGICDCKTPILSNVGKNLFNINGEINEKFSNMFANDAPNTVDGNTIIASSWTGNHHGKGQKIKVKRGKLYTCSFTTSDNGNVVIHTSNKVNFTPVKSSTFTFTAPTDCDEIIVAFNTHGASSGGKIHNLCVVEGDVTSVEYEPYKSNTTTFDQKDDKTIVLRSLPNGVCDTLNVETGEYVQRIGEVVLDGSSDENWNNTSYVDNIETLTQFNLGADIFNGALPKTENYESVVKNAFIQNMFAVQKATVWTYQEGEACAIYMPEPTHRHQAIQAKVLRSRLSSQDVAGWRALLQATPWILQYELATPIVSTIDVQGFPYVYKDGHVQLSSGSIEQSLTPKVEYSLVANRNGQIEANTKSIRRHQDKLDDFEALMLAQIIQTHYEKTLLQFDFEMQMMALGGE